jgi:hypothetical protein
MKKPYPRTLLVEGKDDFNVIRNLWVAQYPSDRSGPIVLCPQTGSEFYIEAVGEEAGGVGEVLKDMTAYLLQRPPAVERVGIVVDADEDFGSRWDEVRHRLRQAGYKPPDALPAEGLVLAHPAGSRPRVGVWLMPNNQSPGILEDFVRLLIPGENRLALKADNTLTAIEDEGLRLYKSRPKALIHTWLAWQEEPGRPMGQAITRKVLQPGSVVADSFVAWLERLFCALYK